MKFLEEWLKLAKQPCIAKIVYKSVLFKIIIAIRISNIFFFLKNVLANFLKITVDMFILNYFKYRHNSKTLFAFSIQYKAPFRIENFKNANAWQNSDNDSVEDLIFWPSFEVKTELVQNIYKFEHVSA